MLDKNTIKENLKKAIKETLKLDPQKELPDENLFASLGIDSLMALELLISIEQAFDIQIEDEDLSVDLLSSIGRLTDYVYEKSMNKSA